MIGVKVCGMTNPYNIKLVSEAKPDILGFIFYPGSPRYVGEEPGKELFYNVPDSIKKTGVFIDEDNRRIRELSVSNGLEMIQLHGEESPSSCLQLKSSGLIIIKAFNVSGQFDFDTLVRYMPVCDYFLFDSKTTIRGGSGKKFSWNKLEEYSLDKPFFLSGGIGPEDSETVRSLENNGLFAVDINSRFETSPGIKDPVLVKRFIEKLKLI